MATYDYIRLRWSSSCNIGDPLNIYYQDGFSNERFFDTTNGGSGSMSGAIYEIEDEGKKIQGETVVEKQTWVKRYMLTLHMCEAEADTLSLLPLHDTVEITDREGNLYTCNGPDVTVDISVETNRELIGDDRYPVMKVDITFNAHQILKTACCTTIANVECSDTAPTIDNVTEISAGVCLVEGTAPDYHLVRLYERELLDKVTVGNGIKINDVCIVSATVAYCCSNLGGIYKTIDGGNTWTIKYPGNVQLNGIAFDGTDKIYAVGDVVLGQGLCVVGTVGVDAFAQVNTAKNESLLAVSFPSATSGYCVGASGAVLNYTAGAWADITPGTVTVLRDVATITGNDAVVFAVGLNYVAWSEDSGSSWTITNYAGEDFNACCTGDNSNKLLWYFGNTNGDIRYTDDGGATSAIEYAGAGTAVVGLSTGVVGGVRMTFGLYSNGYVRVDEYHDGTWPTLWKIKSIATCKRIRAITHADYMILVADGDTTVATTETGYTEDQAVTSAEYGGSGMTFTGVNNVSYQFQVETYLLQSDPCEQSDVEIFTT